MNKGWSSIRLGEVLRLDLDRIPIDPSATYNMVGVLSFGRGLFDREPVHGQKTSYKQFYRLKPDHIVMSQLFGWEGALALCSDHFAAKYVSPQFPTFSADESRLDRSFLGWLMKRPLSWEDLATRTSGMGDRRRTLNPDSLFACEIPLPPLAEQRRIVARIEELAKKIDEVMALREEVATECDALVAGAHNRIANRAPRRALAEVAPLTRRAAEVQIDASYPQVAVRSFGRGTFHKPPLQGSDITWQKPFLVRAGDLLVSNIKAWEGAVAVAKPEDDHRYGSHRYLTFVPMQSLATPRFLCFHLLTPEGLHAVGEASPGSADRNRTLGIKEFLNIQVPVPEFRKQVWFDSLFNEVDALKRLQAETAAELDALLPSILDKAFKGEL